MEKEKKIEQIEIVKGMNDYCFLTKNPSILGLAESYNIDTKSKSIAYLDVEVWLNVFKKWLFEEKTHLWMIYGYLSMPEHKLSIFRSYIENFLITPNDLDKYIDFYFETEKDYSGGNREYPVYNIKITSVGLTLRFEYPEIKIEECTNPIYIAYKLDISNCETTKFSFTYKDECLVEYISK